MPHVSVLLLALAIADKEFAAREPVAVLQQQQLLWRPGAKRLLELGEQIPGQGQGRREEWIMEQGQGRLEERILGQGQGRPEKRIMEQDQGRLEEQILGQRRLEEWIMGHGPGWPKESFNLIKELHLVGRWPLILCRAEECRPSRWATGPAPRRGPLAGSYVLLATEATLPALVDLAAGHPSWNPGARFLVILLDGRDSEDEDQDHGLQGPQQRATAAVGALWARLASRVVVLHALRVFAWSAYSSTCDDTAAVRVVTNLSAAVEEVSAVFRSPRAPAGCPLRYSGVAWPPYVLSGARNPDRGFDRGLDVQMLRTFWRHKGMRPRFVPLAAKEQRWGDSLNGSWTGLLGMLQRGEVDVVFGGFYCLPDRADAFHPTMPYTFEALSWWVPRPQLVPNWQLLFGALPSDAGWGGLLVVTLSAATVLGMQRAQRVARRRCPGPRPRRGDGVVQVILSVVGTALDQPPLVFPRAAAPRLFYFTYVFFFFHFNIVFRTAITNRLASRPHLPGLSTYHDLLLHGFEVGTASTDQAVDIMLDDADMASVRDLHKDCEVSECLRKLQRRDANFGLLFSSAVMQYLTPRYFLDSAGMPYVERLPSLALPTYATMYLRKGHPLAVQVDALFARLVEAGLPDVWLRKAASADVRDKDGDGVPDPEDGGADKVLTLEHLTGALVALGLGASLAVLACLAELATSLGSLVARRLRVSVSWRPATADVPATRGSPSPRRRRRAGPGAGRGGVLRLWED